MAATTPAPYNLVKEFSGTSFFNGWDYFDGYDNTTSGHAIYLPEANATADHLTYVNDVGHAIIKVDNTSTVAQNYKRNSVKIMTHDFYSIGSVFVFDAVHIPFGCSVWPSFWTKGLDWPHQGEIDILEGVNRQPSDQMSLHANPGCSQASGVKQLGKTIGTDCSAGVDSATGCGVTETKPNSFGDDFNDNGGGVWAAQFDVSGIFIWFWSRKDIPANIQNAADSIDPSSWGEPSAAWPSSSCNTTEFFSAQQLVIDITLCGIWAGEANTYHQTCGGPIKNATYDTCYMENVIGSGANYADAYFEIQYIKVFSVGSALAPSVTGTSTILATDTATGTPPSTSTGTAAGTGSAGDTHKNGGAKQRMLAGALLWGTAALSAAFTVGILP